MAYQTDDTGGPVVLAHAPPFRLGAIEVRPATRQIVRGDKSETIEPRVMQVLVALAQARGEVVTRDELLERCWDGRIVGDDSINRVILRIRQLAADLGLGSFQLETITKVGYRMIVDGAPADAPIATAPAQPRVDRRLVLGGIAGAVGLGLAGVWLWREQAPSPERLEASELLRKGRGLSGQVVTGGNEQAVDYFREAVRLDPDYAEAWGALALAYRYSGPPGDVSDSGSGRAKSRSAARRALELDPGNPDARAALALMPSFYGNWAAVETGCRALLASRPDHVTTRFHLGMLMSEVGRWRDAITQLREVNARDPFRPISHYRLINALWSAGRLEEAEHAIENAIARWPRHSAIWESKFRVLAFSGRPEAAIAFAEDRSNYPLDYDVTSDGTRLATVRALASGAREDIDTAVALNLAAIEPDPSNTLTAVRNCAALGRTDEAFALLEGYYFGRGRWARAAPAAADEFTTVVLFYPSSASLWRDRRFAPLLREIGLERYWRATGTRPDYRR